MFNFSEKPLKKYPLEIKETNKLELLISSEMKCYGGKEKTHKGDIVKVNKNIAKIDLPAFCGKLYKA